LVDGIDFRLDWIGFLTSTAKQSDDMTTCDSPRTHLEPALTMELQYMIRIMKIDGVCTYIFLSEDAAEATTKAVWERRPKRQISGLSTTIENYIVGTVEQYTRLEVLIRSQNMIIEVRSAFTGACDPHISVAAFHTQRGVGRFNRRVFGVENIFRLRAKQTIIIE
jgi:hypothetical protein